MDSLGLLVAVGAGVGLWYYLTHQPTVTGGLGGSGGGSGGSGSGSGGQSGTTTLPAADAAFVSRWTGRIASDVANSYQMTLDQIDRAEDAGSFVRVYFTARSVSGDVGRFVANIAKGADPDRLAEGMNRGEYGYRYFYGTSITRIG